MRDDRVGLDPGSINVKKIVGGRTQSLNSMSVRVVCSPSTRHYSGSHVKMSPLVLICSKLASGGQKDSVYVQRQLKLTL